MLFRSTAPAEELRRRISARSQAGKDASEATLAVLERQLATREPLDGSELRSTVRVDTHEPVRHSGLATLLMRRG